MCKEPWYGAKLIFRHVNNETGNSRSFEERVVLVHADTEEAASRRAEELAKEYEDSNTEYTGFIQLFHIFDESIGDGTEVFSLIRESQLSTDEYLDSFYDTGGECERKSTE